MTQRWFGMFSFRFLLLISINLILPKAEAQPYNDVLRKAANLRRLLDSAKHMTPAETSGYNADYSEQLDTVGMNVRIFDALTDLLNTPEIVHYNPDSLLSHPMLYGCYSEDKRLWIFSWYENTGGTFRSYINVIHYRTLSGKPCAIGTYSTESPEDFAFSYGASFSQINKLRNPGKALYVCLGSVQGCNTCCASMASVIELTPDTINFSYPAFYGGSEEKFVPNFSLESRCGDITDFAYNPKKQTLRYAYIPDDLTPVNSGNSKARQSGTLRFNGNTFTGQ